MNLNLYIKNDFLSANTTFTIIGQRYIFLYIDIL